MPVFYQERDAEFIDYEPYLISDKPKFFVRGPKLNQVDLDNGNYFSVLGAAETVGVHAQKPYGAILSDRLAIPYLNLGKGGVCMAFFNQPEMQKVIDYINKGKFLIVTLISGRQTSNSLFKSWGGSSHCVYNNEKTEVERAWELIVEKYWDDKDFLIRLVSEVRKSYKDEYVRFLSKIEVPVILFYYSQREAKYSFDWEKKRALSIWDKFPHLVDDTTISEIVKASKVVYAECLSVRGLPYTLKDKAGEKKPLWDPVKKEFQMYHSYYPSPEMHEDAAEVLEPLCRKILPGGHLFLGVFRVLKNLSSRLRKKRS